MAENVGVHCALSSCHRLDFLPVACPRCRLRFCAAHHTPEGHACAVSPIQPIASSSSGPSIASLLPDRPTRDAPQAATPVELEKERKKAAALALLARNFPTASTSKAAAGPVKSKSRTIEVARLKQRAKAGDPRKDVPTSDRLYVLAVCSCSSTQPAPTRDLYFSRVRRSSVFSAHTPDGFRRQDHRSARDNVRRLEHERLERRGEGVRSPAARLTRQRLHLSRDGQRLDPNSSLSDAGIENGDTISLSRGP